MRTTMASGQQAHPSPAHGLADAQFARVAGDGSARHPYLATLLGGTGANAARDLADAVHLLCHLHGRYPGMIDLALASCTSTAAREWLAEASDQFERERLYLVRLTSAVGPLPSTPGAAESEAAIQGQRHAIETLAGSERNGCALGAATALIGDWGAIRPLLDRAAARAGVECPLSTLPGESSMARAIEVSVDSLPAQRALLFGGEQLLLQHRGLLDLLEARAAARVD
ncbi:MAG: hypothetical protein ABR588_02315 [Sphingomicrobium sp.]|nr:hypothetical protein [Sphingomonadales bacterium]